MSLIGIASGRLGREPDCPACESGTTLSFNWDYARTTARPEHRRDLAVFVDEEPLRHGCLFTCRDCGQPWYLHGTPPFMCHVPRERLPLIRKWNEQPLVLPPALARELDKIGSTPPDIYGNGAAYCETPCTVITVQGERIDLAVVSRQPHAPYEHWRSSRLAAEISEIQPSPHALPMQVRLATTRAQELRMGFSPTLVALPDGREVALNWTQHFFVEPGCPAPQVALSRRSFDWNHPPPVHDGPAGVVYFVADLQGPTTS